MRRRVVPIVAVLAFVSAPSLPARAHNKPVHQAIVDLSYQVMVGVQRYVDFDQCVFGAGRFCILETPPAGVAQADWDQFLLEMTRAVERLQTRPNDLPPPHRPCPGVNDADASTAAWRMTFVPSTDFVTSDTCGTFKVYDPQRPVEGPTWSPGGIFSTTGSIDPTGAILGFHAAAVDDELNDWNAWSRPTNAPLVGGVVDELGRVLGAYAGAVVLPFYCAFDCIFGDCDDCVGDAMDFGAATNPVSNLEALIPHVAVTADRIGQGHHIDMEEGLSNDFDDHQGLLVEEGGPGRELDVIEVGAMAMQDLSGETVDHERSLGTVRYQITGRGDAHQDSRPRSAAEWQAHTAPHTPFTPVDNLAMFGWCAFRDDQAHPLSKLGWPLHALADATVPHHVAGTFGWGHRPFEDAQERNWARIRHLSGEVPQFPQSDLEAAAQAGQAVAILYNAYAWRQRILEWRAANGGGVDVPIRDLVTWVAAGTHERVAQDGWPFQPGASLRYLEDQNAATSSYADLPDEPAMEEPYVIDACGSIAAFLVSASEVL